MPGGVGAVADWVFTQSVAATRLADLLFSLDPILWLSVAVRYSQNPDSISLGKVGNVVGKYSEVDPTIAPRAHSRNVRVLGNPMDVSVDFISKLVPKPWLLLIIVVSGALKLLSRLRKEDDPHAKRWSMRART